MMCNSAVIANNRIGDAKALPRFVRGRWRCVGPVTALLRSTTAGVQATATTIAKTTAKAITGSSFEQTSENELSTIPAGLGHNTDQTGRWNAVSPPWNVRGRRASVPTDAATSTETCNPVSCLALVPLPDSATAITPTMPAVTVTTAAETGTLATTTNTAGITDVTTGITSKGTTGGTSTGTTTDSTTTIPTTTVTTATNPPTLADSTTAVQPPEWRPIVATKLIITVTLGCQADISQGVTAA